MIELNEIKSLELFKNHINDPIRMEELFKRVRKFCDDSHRFQENKEYILKIHLLFDYLNDKFLFDLKDGDTLYFKALIINLELAAVRSVDELKNKLNETLSEINMSILDDSISYKIKDHRAPYDSGGEYGIYSLLQDNSGYFNIYDYMDVVDLRNFNESKIYDYFKEFKVKHRPNYSNSLVDLIQNIDGIDTHHNKEWFSKLFTLFVKEENIDIYSGRIDSDIIFSFIDQKTHFIENIDKFKNEDIEIITLYVKRGLPFSLVSDFEFEEPIDIIDFLKNNEYNHLLDFKVTINDYSVFIKNIYKYLNDSNINYKFNYGKNVFYKKQDLMKLIEYLNSYKYFIDKDKIKYLDKLINSINSIDPKNILD